MLTRAVALVIVTLLFAAVPMPAVAGEPVKLVSHLNDGRGIDLLLKDAKTPNEVRS